MFQKPADVGGWTREPSDDRDPHRPDDQHRIQSRPAPGGLCEWSAWYGGRLMFRWAGPRIGWTHPLVSPWNPILAQDLTTTELQPGWPDDWEQWTADAIAGGWKAGGYFGIRPRRRHHAWVCTHRDRLAIKPHPDRPAVGPWCHAAQPGTLADAYGHDALEALAAAYRAALVPLGYARVADDVDGDLVDYAHTNLLDLVIGHEDVPDVVCGLALGYPPEVTAGTWLHERRHPGELHAAETGAWCETSRRVAHLVGTN